MAIMMELGMQYKERTIEIKMKQTRVSLIKLCAFNEIRYNVSHPTPKVPLFIRSDIKRAVGLIRLKCVVATMHYIYISCTKFLSCAFKAASPLFRKSNDIILRLSDERYFCFSC